MQESAMVRTLSNGLKLAIEPIEGRASVALRWLLPGGWADDPADRNGLSTLLSEFIFRGAAGMTSREHSDALDLLGVERGSDVLTFHQMLEATLLGERLEEALPLLVAMVREPALLDESMDPVRSLALQSLEGLQDEPQTLVGLLLREKHRPSPFNRSGYGDEASLRAATADDVRTYWRDRFRPGGSILSIAGDVDADALVAQLEELLADWGGVAAEPKQLVPAERGAHAITQDTSQVHIALAYDAPRDPDPNSMLERMIVGVLSGGTSGRLFTEVRQKRSLCYSVGASYRAGRDRGAINVYAGTTPERAQKTLDVMIAEIHKMADGVTHEELERTRIRLKSRLIMQGESTPARAGANALDLFKLGRTRSLDELADDIDAITLDQLNAYVAARNPGPFTFVSLGPVELTPPSEMFAPHASGQPASSQLAQ